MTLAGVSSRKQPSVTCVTEMQIVALSTESLGVWFKVLKSAEVWRKTVPVLNAQLPSFTFAVWLPTRAYSCVCFLQDERGADCDGVSVGAESSVLPAHTGRHSPRHKERLHPTDQRRQGKCSSHDLFRQSSSLSLKVLQALATYWH